jgi:hypothetical protein
MKKILNDKNCLKFDKFIMCINPDNIYVYQNSDYFIFHKINIIFIQNLNIHPKNQKFAPQKLKTQLLFK